MGTVRFVQHVGKAEALRNTFGAKASPTRPANCVGVRCTTLRPWNWPMCWAMTLFGKSENELSFTGGICLWDKEG